MLVRLLDVTDEDSALIERRFQVEHVRRFWGEPGENSRLLRELPAGTRFAIIEADGRKVGLEPLTGHPSRATSPRARWPVRMQAHCAPGVHCAGPRPLADGDVFGRAASVGLAQDQGRLLDPGRVASFLTH